MKRLFKEDELKKIEAQIQTSESLFSGQIVVLSVQKSDPYTSARLRLGFIGIVSGSLLYLLSTKNFEPSIDALLASQFFGFVVLYAIGRWSFAIRKFIPASVLNLRVHRAAFAEFVERGVHSTENNNGVLIYLSESERRVQIVADTNAHKALGETVWVHEARKIVEGIKAGKAVNAVCHSIESLASQLQKHFPATALDKNEISNQVLVE